MRTVFRQPGFTLLELVIVVVIIGVIGAIAIPRFASAQESAKISRLFNDLRTFQTAVDLYDAEHDVPIGRRTNGSKAPANTVIERLTEPTDEIGSSGPGAFLGPYLREIPENAINGRSTLIVNTNPNAATGKGWRLDPEISAVTPSVMGGRAVLLGRYSRSGYRVDTNSGMKILDGSYMRIGGKDGLD